MSFPLQPGGSSIMQTLDLFNAEDAVNAVTACVGHVLLCGGGEDSCRARRIACMGYHLRRNDGW